jgi:endonuclease/exonuclease/phosphatase family metal-dependent hydrolase
MKKQDDRYAMIAGDFNTIYGKLELLRFALEAQGFKRAHAHGFTCGCLALDHIFHTRNMRVHANVCKRSSSDHHPIRATVELL